jgi:hypothetical protein
MEGNAMQLIEVRPLLRRKYYLHLQGLKTSQARNKQETERKAEPASLSSEMWANFYSTIKALQPRRYYWYLKRNSLQNRKGSSLTAIQGKSDTFPFDHITGNVRKKLPVSDVTHANEYYYNLII